MANIFISSTSQDLQDHRVAVNAAIERLKQRAIDMKNFGSRPGGAVHVSLSEVGEADIFIGILARRYGYVPAGQEKSVTEQEYDEAVRRNIPRLMYLLDPDYNEWPVKHIENDKIAQERLAKFKAHINANEVRSYFTTPDNLAQYVSADLTEQLKLLKRRQRMIYVSGIVAVIVAILVAAFIVSSVISSGQKEAAISQADREATNNAVAAINKTATATQWTPTPTNTSTATFTPTPTATNTPLPTATPLEGTVADEGEIVIVVANFKSQEGFTEDADKFMENTFRQAVREYDNIRVIRIGHIINGRDEAQDVANTYGATMVVYGELLVVGDEVGQIKTHYEIIPRQDRVQTTFNEGIIASMGDIDNMLLFLVEGQDAEYMLALTLAQFAYYQHNYDSALTLFMDAGDKLNKKAANRVDDLGGADLYFYLAYTHEKLGRNELAIADYTKSIELNSTTVVAYSNRGALYYDLGNFDSALSDYNQAIENGIDYVGSYINRGNLYQSLMQVDSALSDYNQAIKLDPTIAETYSNRGSLFAIMGELDLALADYNQAIEFNDTEPLFYANRGILYRNMREFTLALSDYNQAIEIDADNSFVYSNRGALYIMMRDFELALADFDQAIDLGGNELDYAGRGISYFELGQYIEAISDFREYERLTGQLEPFMIDAIDQMGISLTPTFAPAATQPPSIIENPTYSVGTVITIPGIRPLTTTRNPGIVGIGTICINGTDATVLQTVQIANGKIWVEIDCDTGTGWVEEETLTP